MEFEGEILSKKRERIINGRQVLSIRIFDKRKELVVMGMREQSNENPLLWP